MKHQVRAAQPISRMCHVCGTDNPDGLHARFLELDSGELLGVFAPRESQQGYPGRLHGGIATTILDETMGRAISVTDPDAWGVTVELSVRFRKPVPLDGEVRAVGRVTKDSSRIFEGAGEILLPDGTVAVEATGRFLKMPIMQIAEGDFESEWFADERDQPSEVHLPRKARARGSRGREAEA